jgi:hypothetical protein
MIEHSSLFPRTLLLAVSFAALAGCGHRSSELASFGTPIVTGGQGAALPVSDDFVVDHARQLQERLSTPTFHKALEHFNCGDPVPEYSFYVALYEAAPYASRRVEITYTPEIPVTGRTRCLHFGMDYLLGKAVAELDPTKTFSHTYRKPTGELFEVKTERTTREPHCDCDKRDGQEEWVTFPGPDEDESNPFLAPRANP